MRVPTGRRFVLPALIAGAMACAALASSGALSQNSEPAPTPGYRIAGKVVNSVSGELIPGATVSAYDEDGNQVFASAIADQEGRFSIDRVPAGKYPLSGSKRGYLTSYYDQHGGFNSAVVTGDGQDTANLVFQLTPSAVLRGVITDDAGDPVEGAMVMLFKHADSSAHSQHAQQHMNNATTDDAGAYEFAGLDAGEYLVAVQAEAWYARNARLGSSATPNPLDVAYPITYYDSTTDEASAQPIVLDRGSREEADIVLHAVPALHFTLPVQARRGGAFGPVEMRQSVFGNQISARTAMRGSPDTEKAIEFTGLAPGRYELQQGQPPRLVQLDATVSGEIDPTAGVLSQPVSGDLRFSSGSAVPDEVNIVLAPADGGRLGIPPATAHKGRFQFDAVPPGEWILSANPAGSAPQPLSVVAISAAGKETSGDHITVADRPLSVVVTISGARTRIKGFARAGNKAAPGVMIVLVPRDANLWPSLARRDQSDTDGSFSLADVPAGHYTVIAIEDGWTLDWEDRNVIARYLPGGAPVTITDHSGSVAELAQPVQAVAR